MKSDKIILSKQIHRSLLMTVLVSAGLFIFTSANADKKPTPPVTPPCQANSTEEMCRPDAPAAAKEFVPPKGEVREPKAATPRKKKTPAKVDPKSTSPVTN